MGTHNPEFCPDIPPPPAGPHGKPRPFWSVMIPTFNCANYLRETLAGVLAQDPGPDAMQIEIVDDCSTKDDPDAVVRELGKGRVEFYRNPKNQGATATFSTCISRARGEVVHILHGDDGVQPGFYAAFEPAFRKDPEMGLAFCRAMNMDEHGLWNRLPSALQRAAGPLEKGLEALAVENPVDTPSIVVRRSAYESLGGFDKRLIHAADWEMWLRVASQYKHWYDPRVLALYRVHSASHTSGLIKSGENMEDIRRALDITNPYLPEAHREEWLRKARKHYALYALHKARRLIEQLEFEGARAQIDKARSFSRSSKVVKQILRLRFKMLMSKVTGKKKKP